MPRLNRVSVGVSAHLGWAATSILRVEKNELRVLRTDRIETAKPGDRDAAEPFHVAGGFQGLDRVPQPANPQAALERGLRKQRACAAAAIGALLDLLEGHRLAHAGILVSRGRKAPSFEKAIGSHTQIHIEEGIAVRESIATALRDAGARVHEIDQKTVGEIAAQELGRGEAALMSELGALSPENEGAWRKEEKLATLAAWIAWSRA